MGNFPIDWSEWNGRFRDTVRKFGKGDGGQLKDLGSRLTGSADLYGDDGRSAYNSVNFITCHDGFTLCDLVSYNEKHNEANQEQNRDGTNDNNSWNCGVEGDTRDEAVIRLRKQLIKNYACMLFFSLGTPMMLGGDECLRTQRGNNNAYCQDNDISWIDWNLDADKRAILNLTRKLVHLRLSQPALRRRKYFQGRSIRGGEVKDVAWLAPDGREMTDEKWNADFVLSLGMLLNGNAIEEVDERGEPIVGDTLLVLLNGHSDSVPFALPALDDKHQWRRVLDTFEPAVGDRAYKPGGRYPLQGQSIALFRVWPPLRDRRRAPESEHVAVPATVLSPLVPAEA